MKRAVAIPTHPCESACKFIQRITGYTENWGYISAIKLFLRLPRLSRRVRLDLID